VDATARWTMALNRVGGPRALAAGAIDRGIAWLLAFQNDDGGWAAFDKTKDRRILEKIPFADHNAMQDPSCPDITGRILESLGHNEFVKLHDSVNRAIEYVQGQHDPSAAWRGRW